MIAAAVFAGFLALALVLYLLGSRWLALQEQDARGEDFAPEPLTKGSPPSAVAGAIRRGPEDQAKVELAAWEEEQRRRGRTREEIAEMLANREAILTI